MPNNEHSPDAPAQGGTGRGGAQAIPDGPGGALGRHPGDDPSPGSEPDSPQAAYQDWIQRRPLKEIDAQLLAERMILKWKCKPVIHLLMYLDGGEEALLADTLDTLGAQLYQDWRLTVIAHGPAPYPAFHELPVLRWVHADRHADLAATFNRAAGAVAADWLGFFDPGARFEPHFLLCSADYANLRPGWRLIYTDEDRLDQRGVRRHPTFKPDFNLDMLRSMNYMGNILVRRDAFFAAGGYSDLAGAQTYDIALRVLDVFGEAAIGHITDVLYHVPEHASRQPNHHNEGEGLRRHLRRNGIPARVEPGYLPSFHRVIYEHEDAPLVSVVIPTKDRPDLIKPCLESLLRKTTHPRYEVLVVDNQSTDPEVLAYYATLKETAGDRVRVLSYPHPFNFSAICNAGVAEAQGDYVLLLNNDTQIVQGEWLTRMIHHGQRPEVGIVGARLAYPNTGMIQHAGIVLGLTDIAGHPFVNLLDLSEPGAMGRAQIDQNYSAVTAACMLVRKSVYTAAGGMDADRLPILFSDVDLCLRVARAGYKIVWTPYAIAVHHGSSSLASVDPGDADRTAARAARERETMLERWLPLLARDPAYNLHLSLNHLDWRAESTAVINWDVNFHDRPRILGAPLSGGAGHYRVKAPLQALNRAGLAQCNFAQPKKYFEARVFTSLEVARAAPDVLLHHAPMHDPQLRAMECFRRFNHVFQVYTLDDLVTRVPAKNPMAKHFYNDMPARLARGLAACDRMIVTTVPLMEAARGMIDDIRIVPNYLEKGHWQGLTSQRRQGTRPRVGWAGAQQHHGDLALIVDVVKATAHEIDWIFFGMCPDELAPYAAEVHDFVISYADYAAKLARLNLDLAVAPLEVNPFNEAKSNLRLLEYGILGWPVVCTDIHPYQDAPVERVPNAPGAWVKAIRERAHDLDAAAAEGDRLKRWVERHFLLEDHLDVWLRALLPEGAAGRSPTVPPRLACEPL